MGGCQTHMYIYSGNAYTVKKDISSQQFQYLGMHIGITWTAYLNVRYSIMLGSITRVCLYRTGERQRIYSPQLYQMSPGPRAWVDCLKWGKSTKAHVWGQRSSPLTLIVMCPCTFSISPSMADTKEDFPEPTVPTTATSWPGFMSRFTLKERSVYEGNGWVGAVVQATFLGFYKKSVFLVENLVISPSRLEILPWVYKTPKCFFIILKFWDTEEWILALKLIKTVSVKGEFIAVQVLLGVVLWGPMVGQHPLWSLGTWSGSGLNSDTAGLGNFERSLFLE